MVFAGVPVARDTRGNQTARQQEQHVSVTHSRIQRTVNAGVEEPDAASSLRIAAFLRAVGTQPGATDSARAVAAALLRVYPVADEVELILEPGGEAGGAPGLKLRRD